MMESGTASVEDGYRLLMKVMVGMTSGGSEEAGFMEEINERCSMSRTQRMYGFAGCFGLGLFFLFISTMVFIMPTKFAFTYTIGNLLILGSTGFLIGPLRQLKMMFDPVRIFASIIYLSSLCLALFAALKLHNLILTMIAIILEGCALVWYALSYIPFARTMAKSMLHGCFPRLF